MDLPVRKPNRLPDHPYGPGAYFVTICTHNKQHLLSHVIVGAIHESPEIRLTQYGRIVNRVIRQLPERFALKLDHYVIMPNHIHLLIQLEDEGGSRAIHESPLQRPRSPLSKVIGFLKMNASKAIHEIDPNLCVWQRSFYEHIIRGDADYQEIWTYIDNNPLNWTQDCFYTP